MWDWLKILSNTSAFNLGRVDDAILAAAIEKAVEGTDPRLRLVHNYRKKLAKAVQRSLDYADELVERLADPLKINREAYSLDPRVHACFTSADELQRLFSLDRGLRNFFARPEHQGCGESYMLLAMKQQEKRIFGCELDHGLIKKDVSQVAVAFSDHRFVAPACNETEIHQKLRKFAFNTLVECALRRILSIRVHRQELETERRLLQEKLRTQKKGRYGLESLLEQGEDGDDTVTEEIMGQLTAIEQQLHQTKVALNTLDDYLAQVHAVLIQPEKYLRLEQVHLRLNRMGIKIDKHSSHPGDDIVFHQVRFEESRRFVIALVSYPRREMLPPNHYLNMLLV